jgi:uncharacterized membrane protein YphA (DoxX/SURF4 family)
MDLLFVGLGWSDLAITLNRIAVGTFFMLSGYRKLFNAERHRSIVEELEALFTGDPVCFDVNYSRVGRRRAVQHGCRDPGSDA